MATGGWNDPVSVDEAAAALWVWEVVEKLADERHVLNVRGLAFNWRRQGLATCAILRAIVGDWHRSR